MKIVKVVYISREREITLSGQFAEEFILRFGSLVREEAAKNIEGTGFVEKCCKCGAQNGWVNPKLHAHKIRTSLDDKALTALLEKMGEGV